MLIFLLRRLILSFATIAAISVLSFVIIQLPPGDYIDAYVAEHSTTGAVISAADAEILRRQFGLDEPMYAQYLIWIGNIVRGDLGFSFEWGRPVSEVIGDRIWLTMVLSVVALILTWAIALPIGIFSGVRKYSFLDYLFTFIGFTGIAIPSFLLALIVVYFSFAVLGMNVTGLFSPEYENAHWSWAKAWDLARHLPLPALVLAVAGIAQAMRIMRANLLDELHKPYVVTARAKGLSEMRTILKYPVRVALNPFASTVGYTLPVLVSGSIVVSLVMNLPTVGPVLLKALIAQDMYLAGSIVLILGALTVVGTFISDLVLLWIDPRIRLGRR